MNKYQKANGRKALYVYLSDEAWEYAKTMGTRTRSGYSGYINRLILQDRSGESIEPTWQADYERFKAEQKRKKRGRKSWKTRRKKEKERAKAKEELLNPPPVFAPPRPEDWDL